MVIRVDRTQERGPYRKRKRKRGLVFIVDAKIYARCFR